MNTRASILILVLSLLSIPTIPTSGQSADAWTSAEVAAGETSASVKAHLADGSVFLLPDGARIETQGGETFLCGAGRSVALRRVTALEYYNERLPGEALLRTAARHGATRIDPFQSSATVYAFDGSSFVEEAEAFSTSVLAAAEADDLDRLDAGRVVDGRYRLRLSNHAWETQYVKGLHLLTVDHPPGFEVLPTRKRDLVLVGPAEAPARVTSRDGREVGAQLAAADGKVYRTASSIARHLTGRITQDWVEFDVQVPRGVDEFFVSMRVRNTLFSNVLLEEALLAGKGLTALDLLGGERFRPLEMWRLHRWVRKHMGLRLFVEEDGRFESIDRVGGTGPSAWRQVVVVVPARSAGPVRVRLSFLADSWMIDQVGVSFEGSDRVRAKRIAPSGLRLPDGRTVSSPAAAGDGDYLAVYPGETVEATFEPGPEPAGRRTYFVEAEGYFIKWLNPQLLAGPGGSFKPGDEDVFRAARRWLAQKETMERSFEAGR